jgi:hypothetical protein
MAHFQKGKLRHANVLPPAQGHTTNQKWRWAENAGLWTTWPGLNWWETAGDTPVPQKSLRAMPPRVTRVTCSRWWLHSSVKKTQHNTPPPAPTAAVFLSPAARRPGGGVTPVGAEVPSGTRGLYFKRAISGGRGENGGRRKKSLGDRDRQLPQPGHQPLGRG